MVLRQGMMGSGDWSAFGSTFGDHRSRQRAQFFVGAEEGITHALAIRPPGPLPLEIFIKKAAGDLGEFIDRLREV